MMENYLDDPRDADIGPERCEMCFNGQHDACYGGGCACDCRDELAEERHGN